VSKLIKPKTYEAIANIKLPVVEDAGVLSLDREINLFRALAANGLTAGDDKSIQFALMTIASLLAKTQRVAKVPLMSKVQLHEFAKRLASITQAVTGLDTSLLEGRLYDIVKEERNRKEDFD
jgi:hypothetical protein